MVNESNKELSLTYGTRKTTVYKYQKVDKNTLVLYAGVDRIS